MKMNDHSPKRFKFEEFRLDLRARTLRCRGVIVPLRPKSFEVLAYLVRHAGKPLSKDEIVDKVWAKVAVTDDSLTRCISDARTALNDRDKHIIQTLPGMGYRLSSVVRTSDGPLLWKQTTNFIKLNKSIALAMVLGLLIFLTLMWMEPFERDKEHIPIRASIAVLPFSFTPEENKSELFAEGLANDLITTLAQVPEMLVISLSSTRKYNPRTVDVAEVAREMGVKHVLIGGVQFFGDRVRVSVQLLDGILRTVIWSHRYDRKLADFLSLQDDIVSNILVALQVELIHGETAREMSEGTKSLEAWLLYVQGSAEMFKFNREANIVARNLFQNAVDIDPDWAYPLTGLSWSLRDAIRFGWSKSVESDRERGIKLALAGIEMAPNDPVGYITLAKHYIDSGRIEEGIALSEKAINLSPNHFYALAGLAWHLIFTGEEKRALELYGRSKRINPRPPYWLISGEALALLVDGQTDKSIEAYKKALSINDLDLLHGRIVAAYAEAEQLDKAREHVRILLVRKPDATVSYLTKILRFQDPVQKEWYAGLLQKAGVPEGTK
jgi:TolB-like protein/DNA-binding winged helix-turn-helix (wHTH) protein